MSNTDRFKEGTQYLLNIRMDAENLKLEERSGPAPTGSKFADVADNARIFARVLPKEALQQINKIPDGAGKVTAGSSP